MRYIYIVISSLLLLSCQSASAKKDMGSTPTINEVSASEAHTNNKDLAKSPVIENTDHIPAKEVIAAESMPKSVPVTLDKSTKTSEKTIAKPIEKEALQKVVDAKPNATASQNAIPKIATRNNSRTQDQPKIEATTPELIKQTTIKLDEVTDAVSINQSQPKELDIKAAEVKEPQPKKAVEIALHDAFDNLLKAHVSSTGKVDYAGIKAKQSDLDTYLEALGKVEVSTLPKKAKLAFWINAYNAFTIKKILDNYPVASITDLDGGKPWDSKWIKLNGQTLSLNNIENDIIRPTFNEPRIHFAVNCAAKSCPPLLNKAWTADNLEANFNKQTKAFINNAEQNTIGQSSIQISKIFEWYGVDFGDIIAFLNKYSKQPIDKSATVTYKEYDWTLNN